MQLLDLTLANNGEGRTPLTLTITDDPAGLASGEAHTGTVTFTAQDTAGNTSLEVVPVTMWVDQMENPGVATPTPGAPPQSLFLPIILK